MAPTHKRTKTAIPRWTRKMESARRTVRALATDLTHGLKSTAKRHSKAGSKGEAFRPNPWKKCPRCYHRMPKFCPQCGNGRAGVVPTHTATCCPGACTRCKRCKDPAYGCPGMCPEGCRRCADRCECRDKETDR
jgi:hypothetical protein